MSDYALFIMGKSGCGKSTLEQGLCAHPQFKKVVSATTRLPRPGEVNGQDYYFFTHRKFEQLKHSGTMIQHTSFASNQYGSMLDEYTTTIPFVTLCVVPYSAAIFGPVLSQVVPGIKIVNIYFDITDQRLRENMRKRGDSEDIIEQRLQADDLDLQFKQHNLQADYTITDDTLDTNTTQRVLSWLQQETGAL